MASGVKFHNKGIQNYKIPGRDSSFLKRAVSLREKKAVLFFPPIEGNRY